jgi:hypothetical protein
MGGSKTRTNQSTSFNNTNAYGWQPTPETPGSNAVRDFTFNADPHIGYSYSHARQDLTDSYKNPIGGFYSPNMRDSQLRAGLSTLAQQEAEAQSEANQQLQGQRFGQAVTYASLTAPRLTQTGSSGTGSQQGVTQQSPDILGPLIGGAASGAAA